jgi:hypothetical protein
VAVVIPLWWLSDLIHLTFLDATSYLSVANLGVADFAFRTERNNKNQGISILSRHFGCAESGVYVHVVCYVHAARLEVDRLLDRLEPK